MTGLCSVAVEVRTVVALSVPDRAGAQLSSLTCVQGERVSLLGVFSAERSETSRIRDGRELARCKVGRVSA